MNSAVVLASLLSMTQFGPNDGSAARPTVAKLPHCIVSLIDHVNLPARQPGVLKELKAKEGMIVNEEDFLGKVDDQDALLRKKAAEHRLAVAKEKATNDAELKAAQKIIEVAKAEYEESVAINKRSPGTIPETQMRRQFLQWERSVLDAVVAEMNIEVAKLEQQVTEAELQAVENELERVRLLAPFSGVVVQLYRQQSEWVQPGDPVVRVVRMDRLRVEGFLNSEDFAPEEVLGAPVTINVALAGGRKAQLKGTVDYVSPLVEASGDYRVWCEVDNRPRQDYPWLLRPGIEAEMIIQLKTSAGVASR